MKCQVFDLKYLSSEKTIESTKIQIKAHTTLSLSSIECTAFTESKYSNNLNNLKHILNSKLATTYITIDQYSLHILDPNNSP
jgi:hypothetical protein